MEQIATSSAVLIQNSLLTSAFLITGEIAFAAVFLIGLIVIIKSCWANLKPKRK